MEVIKKEKQTKVVDVVTESYTLCDKCDKKVTTSDQFDAFDFSLTHTTGSVYPDGAHCDTESVQLCKSCAKDFMLMIKDHGYRVNNYRIDY